MAGRVCQASGEDDLGSWSCDRPHIARGWCVGHYEHWRRGEPLRRLKFKRGEGRFQSVEAGYKWCRDCEARLPVSEFAKCGPAYQAYCRNCDSLRKIRSTYRIELDEYAAMLAENDGNCHLCGQPPSGFKRLAVDHDHACCHSTRSCGLCVRGLICHHCNARLVAGYEALPVALRTWDWLNEYLARRPIQKMRKAASAA